MRSQSSISPASPPADAGPAEAPSQIKDQVLDRLVDHYFASVKATGALVIVATASLSLGLFAKHSNPWALAWLAVMVGVGLVWLGMVRAYERAVPAQRDGRTWEPRIFLISLAFGLTYGVSPAVMMVPDDPLHNGLVFIYVLMAVEVAAACNFWLRRATVVACALIGLPLSAWLASRGDYFNALVGMSLAYYTALQLVLAFQAHKLQVQSIERLIRNENLTRRLDEQVRLAHEATRRAEQASVDKSRFLAAANHDLRQPVHALSLMADTLQRQMASSPHGQGVQYLVRAVSELSASLDAMLDISRIDAGYFQVNPQPVAVTDIFLAMHRRFVERANEKGLALRFAHHGEVILADPHLVERLLSNLVDNALKYTTRGGVLVSARRRREEAGSGVLIEVRDSGIGIPQALQQQVFDEFFQVNNAARDRRHGLGLGLSIVRRLAKLMEVPVQLRSGPGCGSNFSFRCRHADPGVAPQPLARQAAVQLPACADLLAGRVILVADNEPAILSGVMLLLQSCGAVAHGVASAAQALDVARKLPRIDAAILDYRLGGTTSGLELARLLRGIPGHARTPMLVVTGDTHSSELEQLRTPDVDVLFKPLAGAALVNAVAQRLQPDSTGAGGRM